MGFNVYEMLGLLISRRGDLLLFPATIAAVYAVLTVDPAIPTYQEALLVGLLAVGLWLGFAAVVSLLGGGKLPYE